MGAARDIIVKQNCMLYAFVVFALCFHCCGRVLARARTVHSRNVAKAAPLCARSRTMYSTLHWLTIALGYWPSVRLEFPGWERQAARTCFQRMHILQTTDVAHLAQVRPAETSPFRAIIGKNPFVSYEPTPEAFGWL